MAERLLAELRATTENKLAELLRPEVVAMLGQLEEKGVPPRTVFASALRRARQQQATNISSVTEQPLTSKAEEMREPPVACRNRLSASLHSMVLTNEGGVLCFGYDPCGPGSHSNGFAAERDTLITLPKRAVGVAAGWSFSVVLIENGQIYACGLDEDCLPTVRNGIAGVGPTPIPSLQRIVVISAGAAHALAVDEHGSAWSWGCSVDGQLGRAGGSRPAVVELPERCALVAAGAVHSLFATADTGSVFAAGHGGSGRLGLGDQGDRRLATKVPHLANVVSIAAGKFHSLAVVRSIDVYAFGDNSYGQLGLGDDLDRLIPTRVLGLPDLSVKQVAAGGAHSLVLLETGEVWGFGKNASGQLGTELSQSDDDSVGNNGDRTKEQDEDEDQDDSVSAEEIWDPVPILDLSNVVEIAAGSDALDDNGHSLAWTTGGTLFGFGSAHYGQIGAAARIRAALGTPVPFPCKIPLNSAGAQSPFFGSAVPRNQWTHGK